MKNKSSKDETAKKKGFYYTLYGSLCVVIALAAVVSVGQLTPNTRSAGRDAATRILDAYDLEPTGSSTVRSYLAPDDQAVNASDVTSRGHSPPAAPAPAREADSNERPPTTAPPERLSEPDAPVIPPPPPPNPLPQTVAAPTFEMFTDNSDMSWPVVGEVVMPFSMNSLVYDKTLDQFRTNDSISIAAVAGTQVKAAADGVVVSVTNTREQGNIVVVDNGNGWTTTYGQLQDGVLVKEGDIVRRSQVIGGVGNPSIFSVLLGNHLELRITKDDTAKNPLDLLTD
jgi:murein DD-endopeptidase MepM/ murein hydrolase activator NlpD